MDTPEGSLSDPEPKISIWYIADENDYKIEEPSTSSTEPRNEKVEQPNTDRLSGFT